MPQKKLKLTVIVLLYHGDRWIEKCVHSLMNQSLDRMNYEIILADNGGSTPSVDNYRGQNNINVLSFPVNFGFAGGNNRALVHARGEIIILMNQDVVVHFNCLQELLNAFNSHPEAGAIAANMLMVSKKDIIDAHESACKVVGFYKLTRYGYAAYQLEESVNDIIPVDFVSGNALGFRKTVLKDIGNQLFDSRLGSYAEDLDFSMRMKNTMWKMFVCPTAVVYHFRDEAFSGKPGRLLGKFIHVSSNRLLVYYYNLTGTGFLKKLPPLLLGIPLKISRFDGGSRLYFWRFLTAFWLIPLIFFYSAVRALGHGKK